MARRITRKQLKQSDEFVSTMDIDDALACPKTGDPSPPESAGICAAAAHLVDVRSVERLAQRRRILRPATTPSPSTRAKTTSVSSIPTGDPDAAEVEFLQVIEHYGRTDQADMARLYLARIYFDRNETDEARDLLVGLAERHRGDTIGRIATLDLIHLRIAAGQATEVAAELEAMVVGIEPEPASRCGAL